MKSQQIQGALLPLYVMFVERSNFQLRPEPPANFSKGHPRHMADHPTQNQRDRNRYARRGLLRG